ncbi:MAG TPA: hypothetical protein VGV38_13180 [Pyrinomonadaceae bacterium]|nr:hypothetical protein [Pyrinomonadaceae bacterium]
MEDKLRVARLALDGASSENVVEICEQYLALLDAYRAELYKLPDALDLNLRAAPSSSRQGVIENRSAVRAAIETTTRERRAAEELLKSFTELSGYEAVETLNRLKHKGRDDWKLNAGGARYGDDVDDRITTVQEVIDTACLLRREEYVTRAAVKGVRAPDDAPWPSRR